MADIRNYYRKNGTPNYSIFANGDSYDKKYSRDGWATILDSKFKKIGTSWISSKIPLYGSGVSSACKFAVNYELDGYQINGSYTPLIYQNTIPHYAKFTLHAEASNFVYYYKDGTLYENGNVLYTFPNGYQPNFCVIYMVLQGGGGGGAGGSTSAGNSGGGGAGGGVLGVNVRLRNRSLGEYPQYGAETATVTVGAAGSAGASKGNGGAGGDTILTLDLGTFPATSYTCYARGGTGGVVGKTGSTTAANSVPAFTTNVSYALEVKINVQGARGLGQGTQAPQYSMTYKNAAVGVAYSIYFDEEGSTASFSRSSGAPLSENSGGGGGCSMFGNGATATSTNGASPASTAYGAGASGGGYAWISGRPGASGAIGCVLVHRPYGESQKGSEIMKYELKEAQIENLVLKATFTSYKNEEAKERDKVVQVYLDNVNEYLEGLQLNFALHPNNYTEESPEVIEYQTKTEDFILYKEWLYSNKAVENTTRFKWLEDYGLLYTSDFQIGVVGTHIICDNVNVEISTYGRAGEFTIEELAYQLLEQREGE